MHVHYYFCENYKEFKMRGLFKFKLRFIFSAFSVFAMVGFLSSFDVAACAPVKRLVLSSSDVEEVPIERKRAHLTDFHCDMRFFPCRDVEYRKSVLVKYKNTYDELCKGAGNLAENDVFHLRFYDFTNSNSSGNSTASNSDDAAEQPKINSRKKAQISQMGALVWSPVVLINSIKKVYENQPELIKRKINKIDNGFLFGRDPKQEHDCFFEIENANGEAIRLTYYGACAPWVDSMFVDFKAGGDIVGNNYGEEFELKNGEKYKIKFYLGSLDRLWEAEEVAQFDVVAHEVPYLENLIAVDECYPFHGEEGSKLFSSFAHPKEFPAAYYNNLIKKCGFDEINIYGSYDDGVGLKTVAHGPGCYC